MNADSPLTRAVAGGAGAAASPEPRSGQGTARTGAGAPGSGSAASETAIVVIARSEKGHLAVADLASPTGFTPIFLKGVNVGVALPGCFPSEFPEDEATYAGWLGAAAELGANAVRIYTLLPPPFYAALAAHNAKNPARKLWLIQGVWTELPEKDDYDDKSFMDGFRKEIRRVVDAVHGTADLERRPGHAHGRYRADVSGSVLAYLLGREWEPFSVQAYDERHAGAGGVPPARESGDRRYVRAAEGATPFERWLAGMLDDTVAYETERYRQQRPVSFVNWPTLDPLPHPTEATVAEEREWLRARGKAPSHPIHEYDNDAVSVDATHLVASPAARGGVFATYHAYPYYPDFMNLDPGYARARDTAGPSAYIGYLRDLAAHHRDQPILIAEVGVPSSLGIAHLQPQGWNHGGHDERAQGEIDARLMTDIHEAGLAGGVLFALFDEWFKRNWLVIEFETPYERKPLWLNALDPEENYGLLAARPGAKEWRIVIDGRGDDWAGIPPLMTNVEAGAPPARSAREGTSPQARRGQEGTSPRAGGMREGTSPQAQDAGSAQPRSADGGTRSGAAARKAASAEDRQAPGAKPTVYDNVRDAREREDGSPGTRVPGRADIQAPQKAKGGGSGPEVRLGDGHDAARTLRSLSVTSDEAYLYLRLDVERLDADGDGSPDWRDAAYLIGIDTYDADRGDRRFPIAPPVPSPVGLEFCLIFDGRDSSRILVDASYDIETHRYSRPIRTVRNDDGRFVDMWVETNRERIGRDGTVYPSQGYNRSLLRHGSIVPNDPDYDSLASWHASASGSFIEARIAWGLLNVTDPSSRRVLDDDPADLRKIGTAKTAGFRFQVVAIHPEGESRTLPPPRGRTMPASPQLSGRPSGPSPDATPEALRGQLADRLPRGGALESALPPLYVWPTWERPTWRLEKKEGFAIVRKALQSLPPPPRADSSGGH